MTDTRPHICDPPIIAEHSIEIDNVARVVSRAGHGVGARFHCPCGQIWVVQPVIERHVTRRWFPETRREARRRLGLHWWQRLPRITTVDLDEMNRPQPTRDDPGQPDRAWWPDRGPGRSPRTSGGREIP